MTSVKTVHHLAFLLFSLATAACGSAESQPTPTAIVAASAPAGAVELEGIVTFSDLSLDHDPDVVYPPSSLPPAGGVHHPAWQNCGIYDQPVETKHAVHSLEHGAVWLTYQPELAAEQVNTLRDLARGHSHVLLSPYPGLASLVVMTAWGLQLQIGAVPDERIGRFIEIYEQGIQTPELGATCAGGEGTPLP